MNWKRMLSILVVLSMVLSAGIPVSFAQPSHTITMIDPDTGLPLEGEDMFTFDLSADEEESHSVVEEGPTTKLTLEELAADLEEKGSSLTELQLLLDGEAEGLYEKVIQQLVTREGDWELSDLEIDPSTGLTRLQMKDILPVEIATFSDGNDSLAESDSLNLLADGMPSVMAVDYRAQNDYGSTGEFRSADELEEWLFAPLAPADNVKAKIAETTYSGTRMTTANEDGTAMVADRNAAAMLLFLPLYNGSANSSTDNFSYFNGAQTITTAMDFSNLTNLSTVITNMNTLANVSIPNSINAEIPSITRRPSVVLRSTKSNHNTGGPYTSTNTNYLHGYLPNTILSGIQFTTTATTQNGYNFYGVDTVVPKYSGELISYGRQNYAYSSFMRTGTVTYTYYTNTGTANTTRTANSPYAGITLNATQSPVRTLAGYENIAFGTATTPLVGLRFNPAYYTQPSYYETYLYHWNGNLKYIEGLDQMTELTYYYAPNNYLYKLGTNLAANSKLRDLRLPANFIGSLDNLDTITSDLELLDLRGNFLEVPKDSQGNLDFDSLNASIKSQIGGAGASNLTVLTSPQLKVDTSDANATFKSERKVEIASARTGVRQTVQFKVSYVGDSGDPGISADDVAGPDGVGAYLQVRDIPLAVYSTYDNSALTINMATDPYNDATYNQGSMGVDPNSEGDAYVGYHTLYFTANTPGTYNVKVVPQYILDYVLPYVGNTVAARNAWLEARPYLYLDVDYTTSDYVNKMTLEAKVVAGPDMTIEVDGTSTMTIPSPQVIDTPDHYIVEFATTEYDQQGQEMSGLTGVDLVVPNATGLEYDESSRRLTIRPGVREGTYTVYAQIYDNTNQRTVTSNSVYIKIEKSGAVPSAIRITGSVTEMIIPPTSQSYSNMVYLDYAVTDQYGAVIPGLIPSTTITQTQGVTYQRGSDGTGTLSIGAAAEPGFVRVTAKLAQSYGVADATYEVELYKSPSTPTRIELVGAKRLHDAQSSSDYTINVYDQYGVRMDGEAVSIEITGQDRDNVTYTYDSTTDPSALTLALESALQRGWSFDVVLTSETNGNLSKSETIYVVTDSTWEVTNVNIIKPETSTVAVPTTGTSSLELEAEVISTNGALDGDTVTWSIRGVSGYDTSGISISGDRLHVSSAAQAGQFTLIATADSDNSKSASKTINVTRAAQVPTSLEIVGSSNVIVPADAINTYETIYTGVLYDQYGVEMSGRGYGFNWSIPSGNQTGINAEVITSGTERYYSLQVSSAAQDSIGETLTVSLAYSLNNETVDAVTRMVYIGGEPVEPTSIIISGPSTIPVPTLNEAGLVQSVDNTYTAQVYDKNNNVIEDAEVTWSLDSMPNGVSLGRTNGLLRVTSSALDQTLVLTASYGGIVKQQNIQLLRDIEEASTLTFTGGSLALRAPAVGNSDVVSTYTAVVKDQYGTTMANETAAIQFSFDLTSGSSNGIYIDENTATITVTDSVNAVAVYEVNAVSGNLTATRTVTINPSAGGTEIDTRPWISGDEFGIAIPEVNTVATRTYNLSRNDASGNEQTITTAYWFFPEHTNVLPEGITISQTGGQVTITVYPEASGQTLVLRGVDTSKGDYAEQELYLYKDGSQVRNIGLNGPAEVVVPQSGENSVTYQGYGIDQYGQTMAVSGTFTYTLADDPQTNAAPTGVSLNESTGRLTVDSTAAAGSTITVNVALSGTSYTASLDTDLVDTYTAEPTALVITDGATNLSVPRSGATTQESYVAQVTDQYGGHIPGMAITWRLDGPSVTGISIGSTTGLLTVNSQAPETTVLVTAETGLGLSAQRQVRISRDTLELAGVNILGGTYTMNIPGAGVNSETFSAEAYDQYGDAIVDAEVTFEITAPTGLNNTVFFSDSDLIVTPNAVAQTIVIRAVASYNGVNKASSSRNVVLVENTTGEDSGSIAGSSLLVIPGLGAETTSPYTFKRGGADSDEVQYWELDSPLAGVSINTNTGLLTITDEAQATSFTIVAYTEKGPYYKTVTLRFATAEAKELKLEGEPTVAIPPTSEVGDTVRAYVAKIFDQYGKEMTSHTVSFAITPEPLPTGVTFADGILTVSAAAMENTKPYPELVITATSNRDSDLTDQITVNLVDVSESLVRDIYINGDNAITVPPLSVGATSKSYGATIYGYTGNGTLSGPVTWSLKEAAPAGVTLNATGNTATITVTSVATDSIITLAAEFNGFEKTHTIRISREASAPQSVGDIEILGANMISVIDNSPVSSAYTVEAVDQYGKSYTPAAGEITWSLAESYTGVFLDGETGTVTVLPTIVATNIFLQASLPDTQGNTLTKSKDIYVFNSNNVTSTDPVLSITGVAAIAIPEKGGVATEEEYRLQEFNPVTGQTTTRTNVYWSLKEETVAGVNLVSGSEAGAVRISVGESASGSIFTLVALDTIAGDDAEKEIRLIYETSTLQSIALAGPEKAPVPEAGATTSVTYSAQALDQYENPLQVAAVFAYEIETDANSGLAPAGVSINRSSGVVTIDENAQLGTTYKVKATLTYNGADYTATKETALVDAEGYDPEPASIEIVDDGATLYVPNMNALTEHTYRAKVIDKYGNEIKNPEVTWRFDSPSVDGVTIDYATGTLTVTQEASNSTVVIAADCGELSATKTVLILREATRLHAVKIVDGPYSLDKPSTGVSQGSFETVAYNQYGELLGNVNYTYQLTEEYQNIEGVTFSDNRIVITSDVNELYFTIEAVGRHNQVPVTSAPWPIYINGSGDGEESHELKGVGVVYIPDPLNSPREVPYTYYQNGFARTSGVTFALDQDVKGISIGRDTGMLTVTNQATPTEVTITGYTEEGQEASRVVKILYDVAAVKALTLTGDSQVVIPPDESFGAVNKVYVASVLDQYDRPIGYEEVVWSTSPAALGAGITLKDGVLTITHEATAQTITIRATSESDGTLYQEQTVTLLDQSDTTVKDITIQGRSQITVPALGAGRSSETYLAVISTYGTAGTLTGPVTWSTTEELPEGIAFTVSVADGNQLTLTVAEGVENTTITLLAAYDGYQKSFDVSIKRADSAPEKAADLNLSGSNYLWITESVPGTAQYSLRALDQYGEQYVPEQISWSLDGNYEGVYLDDSGYLTALPIASDSTVVVRASVTSLTGETLTAEKPVMLYNTANTTASYTIIGAPAVQIPASGISTATYTLYRSGASVHADNWYVVSTGSGVSMASDGTLSVSSAARAETITIMAVKNGEEVKKDILLKEGESELFAVSLNGPAEVRTPALGTTETASYSLVGYDQKGEETAIAGTTLYELVQISGASGSVSINRQTGLVTITDEAQEGDVYEVTAEVSVDGVLFSDSLQTTLKNQYQQTPSRLSVVAEQTILTVPALGEVNTAQFTALVYDQYDLPVNDAAVKWTIGGSLPEGVSLDYNTGELTVLPTAASGTIQVVAQYQGLTDTVLLTITRAVSTLQRVEILDGPVSLNKPVSGATSANFTAAAYDQYGQSISGVVLSYAIADSTGAGSVPRSEAYFNGSNLVVTSAISESALTITATASLGTTSATSNGWTVMIAQEEDGGNGTVHTETITGDSLVSIPQSGESASRITYRYLQNGVEKSGAQWMVSPSGNGVSMGLATGILTVSSSASEGSLVVTAYPPGREAISKTIFLIREESVVSSIAVSGSAQAIIPLAETTADTVQVYLAKVLDQNNKEMAGEEVVWSLVQGAQNGVSFVDGVLRVSYGAQPGVLWLQAQSKSDSGIIDQYAVELLDLSASTVKNIQIEGATELLIPAAGEAARSSTYQAYLYSYAQNGNGPVIVAGAVAEWHIEGALPEGVSADINENQLTLRLEPAAKSGVVVLTAAYEGLIQTHTIAIVREESYPSDAEAIQLTGATEVFVNGQRESRQYQVIARDQYGEEYLPQGVSFALAENTAGVSVEAASGWLRILPTIESKTITVTATVPGQGGSAITVTKDVVITNQLTPGEDLATLIVSVQDEQTESPVPGAAVQLGDTVKTTDEYGTVSFADIAPGSYTVTISHLAYNSSYQVVSAAAAQVTSLTVSLSRNSSDYEGDGGDEGGQQPGDPGRVEDDRYLISGQIIDANTEEIIVGAVVTSRLADSGNTSAVSRVESDIRGRYALGGYPSQQTVAVTVTAEGYQELTKTVTIATQDADEDFALSPLVQDQQTGQITVQVQAEDRTPLSEATIYLGSDGQITSESGEVTFTDLAGGTYLVTVSRNGYETASQSVTLVADTEETVTIYLRERDTTGDSGRYTISGVVVDEHGDALTGVAIGIINGVETDATESDLRGRFAITRIPQGNRVSLSFQEDGYYTEIRTYANIKDDYLTEQIVLRLVETPSDGTSIIYGIITDQETGAAVKDATVKLNGRQTATDGSGQYIFTDVEPGNYLLVASHSAYNTGFVKVTAEAGIAGEINLSLARNSSDGDDGGGNGSGGDGDGNMGQPGENSYLIFGQVTDAETEDVLAGVTIRDNVDGQVVTGADGIYVLGSYAEGTTVILTFEAEGYQPVRKIYANLSADAPDQDVSLKQIVAPTDGTATVYGAITDQETGAVVKGATVKLNNQETQTDKNGQYIFTGVEPGAHLLVASHNAYNTGFVKVTTEADTATEANLSLARNSSDGDDGGGNGSGGDGDGNMGQPGEDQFVIYGQVTDTESKKALAGAVISDGTKAAITDDSGTYIFTGYKPDAEVDLTVKATGYETETRPVTIDSDREENFALSVDENQGTDPGATGATLTVMVTATDGTLLNEATVNMGSDNKITDHTGSVTFEELAADTYLVIGSRDGYNTNSMSVTLTEKESKTVLLTLSERGEEGGGTGEPGATRYSIGGVIQDENETPLAGVTIKMGNSNVMTINRDGRFLVSNIQPEATVSLSFQKDGYHLETQTYTKVSADQLTETIVLRAVEAPNDGTSTIYGTITDQETGAAVKDATVKLNNKETQTKENGQYIFTGIEPGNYLLVASHSAYNTGFVMVSAEANTNVEANLSLARNSSDGDDGGGNGSGGDGDGNMGQPGENSYIIFGQVTDVETEDALAGVTVRDNVDGQVVTDADGIYVLGSYAESTTVVLTFEAEGYQTARKIYANLSADAANQDVSLKRIVAPTDGTAMVYGAITDQETGAVVKGATVKLNNQETQTDKNGQYIFVGVEPGAHLLVASHSAYNTGFVKVTTEADTAIEANLSLTRNSSDGDDGGGNGSGGDGDGNMGQPGEDQYAIYGQVTDVESKKALADAVISDGTKAVITDDSGTYIFTGYKPDAEVELTVKANGYETETRPVTINGDQEENFALSVDDNQGTDPGTTGATLTVMVTATDGTLINGATVSIGNDRNTTDHTGTVTFEELAADTYLVIGSCEGYNTNSMSVTLTEKESKTVLLALSSRGEEGGGTGEPGATRYSIGGVVQDENETPLAGVTIKMGNSVMMTTNRDGRFLVSNIQPEATATLSFQKEGYHLETQTYTKVSADQLTETIVLRAVEAPNDGTSTIYGTITDQETGAAVKDATVKLNNKETQTKENGQYIFTDVEPGNYLLVASHSAYNTGFVMVTAEADKYVEANLSLARNSSDGGEGGNGSGGNGDGDGNIGQPGEDQFVIYGQVTDAESKKGLPSVVISDGTKSATTDDSGIYIISGYRAKAIVELVVRADGYETETRQVTVSGDQEENFALNIDQNPGPNPGDDRFRIVGEVRGEDGSPLGDVSVQVAGTEAEVSTNAQGQFQMEDLPADSTVILYFSKEEYESVYETYTINDEDLLGQIVTMTKVAAPDDGKSTVYGIVADAETFAPIEGTRVQLNGIEAITEADGRYHFDNVEPATYLVITRAEDYNTSSVTVVVDEDQTATADILLNRVGAESGGNGGEPVAHTYVITGQVSQQIDGELGPIDGATVTDGSNTVTTDSFGYYLIGDYEDGDEVELTVSATGYTTQKETIVIQGEDRTRDFTLPTGNGEEPQPPNPNADHKLVVEGLSSIRIPESGSAPNTLQLNAIAYEDGAEYEGAEITWSIRQLTGKPITGVSVGADGELQVSSQAKQGTVLVEAAWKGTKASTTKLIAVLSADSNGSYLLIDGESDLEADAKTDLERPYQALLYDEQEPTQKGTRVNATFTVEGDDADQVTIDPTSGLLKVGSKAKEGYYTIKAVYTTERVKEDPLAAPATDVDLAETIPDEKQDTDDDSAGDAQEPSLTEDNADQEPQETDLPEESSDPEEVANQEEPISQEGQASDDAQTAEEDERDNSDVLIVTPRRSLADIGARLGRAMNSPADEILAPLAGDDPDGEYVTYEAELIIWIKGADQSGDNGDNGNNGGNGDNGGGTGGNGGGSGGGGGGGGSSVTTDPDGGAGLTDPSLPSTTDDTEYLALDNGILRYLNGYPDGTIRPDSSITRAETAVIFHQLVLDEAKDTSRAWPFKDSGAGWYATAVAYLTEKGVLNGYPDGTYRPNDEITRAEFAVIVSRFSVMTDADTSFQDLSSSHWAYRYIASAVSNGYLSGYPDGTFRPDEPITRAEAVTIVNQLLGWSLGPATGEDDNRESTFTDLADSHWARFQILDASLGHSPEEAADDEDGSAEAESPKEETTGADGLAVPDPVTDARETEQ